MKHSYDAIIIGGGIVGAAICFELAKRRFGDILLVEEGAFGLGAAERVAYGVGSQWVTSACRDFVHESIPFYRNLAEYTAYTETCGWLQSGSLALAYGEGEFASLRRNPYAREISLEELLRFAPFLNLEGIRAAFYGEEDGAADSYHCVRAYLHGAKQLGADLLPHARAEKLLLRGVKVRGIETERGSFLSPLVINACGYAARALAKQVGDMLPLTMQRREFALTEALPRNGTRTLSPAIFSSSPSFFCRENHDGSFLIGNISKEIHSFDLHPGSAFLEEMGARVIKMAPALSPLRICRQWAGYYDKSPDAAPIVVSSRNGEGLLHICGFSANDFSMAPRLAVLIANRLTKSEDEMSLRGFSLDRFRESASAS